MFAHNYILLTGCKNRQKNTNLYATAIFIVTLFILTLSFICTMETYGKILLIAMPVFLLLVLLEKWYGYYKNNETVHSIDAISSLTSGITNATKDVLQIGITILGYSWLVQNFAIYTVQNVVLTYIIAFFALDFTGYWVHRIQHKINFFWNYHIIHHSSEEFNLACALRQSISGLVNIFSFFLLPAALLGVPTQVIATVAPLHLFAQFWYHTQHINKMGFLEHIIVTPSHHRVHHAINKEYIDKNFSQIFIFWDKIFGTFQEELKEQPPVYGITVPVNTWNPIKINFQHLWLLCKDAWRTHNYWDKLRIWFMPTGWRPVDVEKRYPLNKIEDPYNYNKYTTAASSKMVQFYWLQLIILLLFVAHFFGNVAKLNLTELFLYGLYIYTFVYALTDLMDNNKTSILFAGVNLAIVLSILLAQTDWFYASNIHIAIPTVVFLYNIFAFAATLLFYKKQIEPNTIKAF
jgi:alkylglycerol monooxygenase